MSNVVSKVVQIQLTVSEEEAIVIKSLLYALNWDQFKFAETLAVGIEDLELEENVSIFYNEESGEFERN